MLNNGSDGHPFDDNGGKDEGGLRAEDFEIRMDLTDDLLHMVGNLNYYTFILVFITCILFHFIEPFGCFPYFQVFSFLDHRNLCHAAMVCRQWQAASAHEDFWRCLNFENRNISLEQCEFHICIISPGSSSSGSNSLYLEVS